LITRDVGTKKALVVLRVRLDILSQRSGALGLADCECIGLHVSETVNGDTLARELEEIFAQAGTPVGIIKDCDATLNKGVRLWSQSRAQALEVIDDVSHVMASALKKQYENSDAYKQFILYADGGFFYSLKTWEQYKNYLQARLYMSQQVLE
jgi:hypothetical protein